MLPGPVRMRSSEQFNATVRDGVRARRPTVVVHASRNPAEQVQVGFVVSKRVGNAVVRNRVKRRLRHLVLPMLEAAPAGLQVVVRALPAAADQTQPLASDLAKAWQTSLARLGVPA
ncbi:MAG: ribonuclease P protein component [Brooklawnia sp.]|jgi:ribonuclease P protein component